MKKNSALLVFLFSACLLLLTTPSCSRKTGCPINEKAHVQPNKKGEYKKSKTRSGLFPKGMNKRRKH
ncbi:MAG TPA: hypothetical protein ENJ95_09465 [Bacteroidetes bacterium]|nr:hypothetical protein [Bacteroidota bacterium]